MVRRLSFAFMLLLVLFATLSWILPENWLRGEGPRRSAYLLLPDGLASDDEYAEGWMSAAREEGLQLEPLTASEILRPRNIDLDDVPGIIVPDTIHARANEILTNRLDEYVKRGGQLLLVHDALTLSADGTYPKESRVKNLLGIEHALYESLREGAFRSSPTELRTDSAALLSLPPGTYSHAEWESPSHRESDFIHTLSAYLKPELQYRHFVTRGAFKGQELMRSPAGDLVAGIRRHGKGSVLFVNLPLSYFKVRTDGDLMHSFLRLFAKRMLGLPSLLAVPEGQGGLVVNLHVDSNAALAPLQQLKQMGFFDHGPYSVHFTAGPDTREPGDGLGFDVVGNAKARQWVKELHARGNSIGSHGGWIHNHFGLKINDSNRKDFVGYLELNKKALEEITGEPVVEYSAPMGNQPEWVSRWLEKTGHSAYYSTGDIGLGPTKSHRAGMGFGSKLWAFPVMVYFDMASFEDAVERRIPERHIASWLIEMSQYVRDTRQARLVYFHPPGLMEYPRAVRQWMSKTRELTKQGGFRWYTMSDLARFLDRRGGVSWSERRSATGSTMIEARSESGLKEFAWQLPKSHYARPSKIHGNARIEEDAEAWIVVGQGGQTLKIETDLAPSKHLVAGGVR